MVGMVRDNPVSWKLRAAKRQLAAKLGVESSQNLPQKTSTVHVLLKGTFRRLLH